MIISFYSYKGGVGRTQLAVNLASYLCYHKGLKILMIDWDLEAPGLHFYFKKDEIKHKGIIDLFVEFETKFQNYTNIKEADLPKFDDTYIVKNVSKTILSKGRIDLITAGYYDESYKEYNKKVNTFNWQNFYEKLDGVTFIEYLKKQLKDLDYDFIFIDSRTGVSDYSGIVNVQVPDINILVIAPTKQNFTGSYRIAENIKNSNYVQKGYRKPIIMPILSRIDLSIEQKSDNWLSDFKRTFGSYIRDFCEYSGLQESEYISDTLLDYKRDISFGEQVLFSSRFSAINEKTLARQYQLISEYIIKIKKPETEIKRTKKNIKDINLKSDINSVFVFGNTGVGKSTLLASISKYLSVNFRLEMNPDNKQGMLIMLNDWIRQLNKHSFPSRTPIETINEIDIKVNTETPIRLKIFELAGENLNKIDIENTGELSSSIINLINSSNIYFIVTDVNNAQRDDILIWQFFNLLQHNNIDIKAICLFICKWDLLKEEITINDFVKESMPQCTQWLNSNSLRINTISVFSFSIGKVTDDEIVTIDYSYPKIVIDWLFNAIK